VRWKGALKKYMNSITLHHLKAPYRLALQLRYSLRSGEIFRTDCWIRCWFRWFNKTDD